MYVINKGLDPPYLVVNKNRLKTQKRNYEFDFHGEIEFIIKNIDDEDCQKCSDDGFTIICGVCTRFKVERCRLKIVMKYMKMSLKVHENKNLNLSRT